MAKSFGGFPTPNLQTLSGDTVMDDLFFLTESEWENARINTNYDIVIIGSSFCSLAVAKQALTNDPSYRILIIERSPFFLPSHFQNLGKLYQTIAGRLETFPRTMSAKTAQGDARIVRSVTCSTWCPEPTLEEMYGWLKETIEAARCYFPSAKELLNVKKADEIDADNHEHVCQLVTQQRPIYGKLQAVIQGLLKGKGTKVHGIYRTEAAPMAVDGRHCGVNFAKFSVPAELLSLVSKQESCKPNLDIVTNCIVEKIIQQNQLANALKTLKGVLKTLKGVLKTLKGVLKTLKGVLSLGNAKLVLAMGTLLPTTLVRNSFPQIDVAGHRFGAHFISSIIARVPQNDFECSSCVAELEIGAFYIAGKCKDYKQQYYIQLTDLSDKNPEKNTEKALRYMPDAVATASMAQLLSSKDHVIFVCAVLGEMDATNTDNWFLPNNDNPDLTTNSMLQVTVNDSDRETWNAMDNSTFGILEEVVSPRGRRRVEYWHGTPRRNWTTQRPSESDRRLDTLVHDSSMLHIGEAPSAPVDTNYCVRGTNNVYITGGSVWPRGGSWNPTLTMVALAQHLADQLVKKRKPGARHVPKGGLEE